MEITNYKDYLNVLNGRGDVIVFRGQAKEQYVLIPSGLRGDHIKEADTQMFKFVEEMRNLFSFDELTCIEIAQHFLLPTRMLDFTYSYDVALFFACIDHKGRFMDENGKVFIFNKSKYERKLLELHKKSSEASKNNKFLYEWLEKYVEKQNTSAEEIDMPIFVDATQQFDRIYLQKGLFLLWGKDEIPFEQIMEKENIDMSEFVDTIIIPKEAKPKILEELRKKNICEDSLYMNIDKIRNLACEIKSN